MAAPKAKAAPTAVPAHQAARAAAPGTNGEAAVSAMLTAVGEEDDLWQRALAQVVPACVVLKTTSPFSYDTDNAGSSHASGFVVDSERGLILTNRHVVTPGPVVSEAIFQNHEEVDVAALYRDPVHDFGFFRFDPRDVTFMAARGMSEVPLDANGARVGLDVRVVGNDSGEKLSIASATLARLDRDAPLYGKNQYNDFNIFYLQAASGTKGGSSGSPVIDRRGVAVGLNAGSRVKSSSAFFLPLHAVVRALKLLQAAYDKAKAALPPDAREGTAAVWSHVDTGAAVPRGAIQSTLLYKGFDECRRLGLTPQSERTVRERRAAKTRAAHESAPSATGTSTLPPPMKRIKTANGKPADAATTDTEHGLLVVDIVTPDGPAALAGLKVGDVVLTIGGQPCDHFLDLEGALDAASATGATLEVEVERGGKKLALSMTPGDLHEATLPRFVFRYGGGVLHPLGYQTARNHQEPCGLPFVADPGHALGQQGVPRHAIITSVDGVRVSCTMDIARILRSKAAAGVEKVPIAYYHIDDASRRLKNVPVRLDDRWYGTPRLWCRNDRRGVWQPLAEDWEKYLGANEADFAKTCESMSAVEAAAWRAMRRDAAAGAARTAPVTIDKAAGIDQPMADAGAALPPNAPAPAAEAATPGNSADAWDGAPPPEASLPPSLPVATKSADAATVDANGSAHDTAKRVFPSLCLISADVPSVALLDGVHSKSFEGAGVVVCHDVEHDIGIVLTDRNTVTVSTADLGISFAAYPSECVGVACFFHPTHNFVLVRYRPSALSEAARAAVMATEIPEPSSSPAVYRGMEVVLVGLSGSLQPVSRKCHVTNCHAAVVTHLCDVPRYRSMHEEVIELDNDFGSGFSGALTDKEGRLLALYGSFSKQVKGEEHEFVRGIPVAAFARWCSDMKTRCYAEAKATGSAAAGRNSRGVPSCPPAPWVPSLDLELSPMSLNRASELGLPAEWISTLTRVDPERRQVLRVRSTFSSLSSANEAQALEEGDFVVSANGRVVTHCDELDELLLPGGPGGDTSLLPTSANMTAGAMCTANLPPLVLGVYRSGKPLQVRIPPTLESGAGTSRHILWAGAQLQEPHRGVRELGYSPYDDADPEDGGGGASAGAGVYISRWHTGSPAHRYGLYALHWVTHVNDTPVHSLDDFLAAVVGASWRSRVDNGVDAACAKEDTDAAKWVRLRVVHLKRKPKVITVKLDLQYWPTTYFERDTTTGLWRRSVIQGVL